MIFLAVSIQYRFVTDGLLLLPLPLPRLAQAVSTAQAYIPFRLSPVALYADCAMLNCLFFFVSVGLLRETGVLLQKSTVNF